MPAGPLRKESVYQRKYAIVGNSPQNFKPSRCLLHLVVPWSAKRASWLVVQKPPDWDEDDKAALARIIEADPEVALGLDLARQFITMVRHRQEERLDPWMEAVKTGGIPALVSFVNGLQKDLVAVRNALRQVCSNGQTEGHVNRLKFIKRQMYGRAKFDLLRKRVLPRAAPTPT